MLNTNNNIHVNQGDRFVTARKKLLNIIYLACWKFTDNQSERDIARPCQAERLLAVVQVAWDAVMSEVQRGRLCYYKAWEGRENKYIEKYNVKVIKRSVSTLQVFLRIINPSNPQLISPLTHVFI